jgi:hypothetical protein
MLTTGVTRVMSNLAYFLSIGEAIDPAVALDDANLATERRVSHLEGSRVRVRRCSS